MAAKGAFPHLLGAHYALDPIAELFIPGVDGEPEFKSLDQRWRALEPIDETDVLDVLKHGIVQPIRVRKRKDGKAEVTAGRQRARWIRAANERLLAEGVAPEALMRIPVILDSSKDEAILARKMRSENYHRVEPSIMQKSDDAWSACVLAGETDPTSVSKDTLQEIAVSMRCSVSTVRNYIALQRLSDKAKRAAANRELGVNVLVALADLSEDEQDARLDDFFAKKASGATNADLVEAARNARDESAGSGVTAPESKRKTTPEGSGAADDGGAPKGLRMAQVKALLRLAKLDRESGHGAGTSLSDDVVRFLEIVVGDAKPSRLKGVTELLNRAAKGE